MTRRRRVGRVALVATLGLVGVACLPKAAPVPEAPNCPMMPADNYWHARVNTLPVHPLSDEWVDSIGRGAEVHADFGSGEWDGGPIGIPYTVVNGSQPAVDISFYYPTQSDPGPYRIPDDALIEGGPDADGDRHILIVDRDNCILTEVFDATQQPDGSWEAGSGAHFNMQSNAFRPAGWTSADAAGLPILPGLVRFDEVNKGIMAHAIRFTAPDTQTAYIWPARHQAGDSADPNLPPMGAWFRLKAGAVTAEELAGFSPHAQTIIKTMQTYGMILADNGSPWYISGVPNESWDNDVLHELDVLTGDDFEAVNTAGLIVDPNTGQFKK